jgi:hypothetical protein
MFPWLLFALLAQDPVVTFGTTVVSSSGFRGDLYFLKDTTTKLPNFGKMKPVGSIYTPVLRVTPREFSGGFPGVTERVEWFAIDYNGRFWIEQAGKYDFYLLSDDGSKLYIDGHTVINNDGLHGSLERTGSIKLKPGVHQIRVSYFQGPRFHLALVLEARRPGEDWRPFNLDRYLPPPGHENWK